MKTNDLRYTTTKTSVNYYGEKADIIVKIRLNDECKNGHQDFSITGDIYKAGRRGDNNYLAGGCIHEEIAKHFPQFKIFIRLHLADAKGVPMYAVENGFYHLRNGFNKTKPTDDNFKAEFCEYYRLTPVQFDTLNESEHKLEYAILLKELGVLGQWYEEAQTAIKLLEELTGNEFVNDSKKEQYTVPTADKINSFYEKKEAGYYSLENKRKRAEEERAANKAAKIQKIKDACSKDIKKHEEERDVKLWLISHIEKLQAKKRGFTLDYSFNNYIFYNHTKELEFNWLDYERKMSPTEWKMFCDTLNERDFNKLPANIKFNFEGKEQFSR